MKTNQKAINIHGKIVNESGNSQQGTENLLVEVWDRNIFKDDLLGQSLTKEDGQFNIKIDTCNITKRRLDQKLDIYFVIYHGDNCIKNTSQNTIKNVDSDYSLSLGVDLNKSDETRKERNIYIRRNERTRIECVSDLDKNTAIQLDSFFQAIGDMRTWKEYIQPIAEQQGSQLVLALRDRPWPPYGIHGQTVIGLCLIYDVGTNSKGISPVYTRGDENTNIGLVSALFMEALRGVVAENALQLKYMVEVGTVLGPAILSKFGFTPDEKEIFIMEEGNQFYSFSIPPNDLIKSLKYEGYETSDILEYDVDYDFVELNALFHGFVSARGSFLDKIRFDVLRVIDIGGINMLPPGGVYS